MEKPRIGAVTWFDLTVPDAERLRDFYGRVVGWGSSNVKMGDYDDYCMTTPDDSTTVAGLCHARGKNAGLPPQWLIYITVADLDASMRACTELGGSVISEPESMGDGARFCVIRDPAGAIAARSGDRRRTGSVKPRPWIRRRKIRSSRSIRLA